MTAKKHQKLIDNYHKEQLQSIKPEHDLEEDEYYDDEDKTIH